MEELEEEGIGVQAQVGGAQGTPVHLQVAHDVKEATAGAVKARAALSSTPFTLLRRTAWV